MEEMLEKYPSSTQDIEKRTHASTPKKVLILLGLIALLAKYPEVFRLLAYPFSGKVVSATAEKKETSEEPETEKVALVKREDARA